MPYSSIMQDMSFPLSSSCDLEIYAEIDMKKFIRRLNLWGEKNLETTFIISFIINDGPFRGSLSRNPAEFCSIPICFIHLYQSLIFFSLLPYPELILTTQGTVLQSLLHRSSAHTRELLQDERMNTECSYMVKNSIISTRFLNKGIGCR